MRNLRLSHRCYGDCWAGDIRREAPVARTCLILPRVQTREELLYSVLGFLDGRNGTWNNLTKWGGKIVQLGSKSLAFRSAPPPPPPSPAIPTCWYLQLYRRFRSGKVIKLGIPKRFALYQLSASVCSWFCSKSFASARCCTDRSHKPAVSALKWRQCSLTLRNVSKEANWILQKRAEDERK